MTTYGGETEIKTTYKEHELIEKSADYDKDTDSYKMNEIIYWANEKPIDDEKTYSSDE